MSHYCRAEECQHWTGHGCACALLDLEPKIDETHVQYVVQDETHTHTDAELIELYVTNVLGIKLEPWQREFLNSWVRAEGRAA